MTHKLESNNSKYVNKKVKLKIALISLFLSTSTYASSFDFYKQHLSFPADGQEWSHTDGSPKHKLFTRSTSDIFGSKTIWYINDKHALDLNKNWNDDGSDAFNSDRNKPVLASMSGSVIYVDKTGLGFVIIKHSDNEWATGYMHMRDINVNVGDSVREGDAIGKISNRGTGNHHLHYSLYRIIYMGPFYQKVNNVFYDDKVKLQSVDLLDGFVNFADLHLF